MAFLMFLLFAFSSTAQASNTDRAIAETCAAKVAETFADSTRLGITDVRISDYGYGVYSMTSYEREDSWSHGSKWVPRYSKGGASQQNFRIEAENANTKLTFTLGIRFLKLKEAPVGSGTAKERMVCCSTQDQISVTDLGNKNKRSFAAVEKCDWLVAELQDRRDIVQATQWKPNLCSAFGKRSNSWKSTREYSYDDVATGFCDDYGDKKCHYTKHVFTRDVYSLKGCEANGRNLIPEIHDVVEAYAKNKKTKSSITPEGKYL